MNLIAKCRFIILKQPSTHVCLLMVFVRVFIASFRPGKKGNNGQSIQVRSFINLLDDDINWLLRLRDINLWQRLWLIVAGSAARDCHRSTKLCNIRRERLRDWECCDEWDWGSPLGREAAKPLTISLMRGRCQFTSHRLDLGHHHQYYNKLRK